MNYLIITGANGGIGTEICKLYKKNNWFIIGLDIHDKKNLYIDTYYKINLFNSKEIINFIKNIEKVNCFIHCAAYQSCKPIWKYTEKEWDNSYKCNVKSVFLFIKYGIKIFKKYKTNIINIASIHASNTSENISAYASSKAALVGLTRNLAIDLAKFGIRVNSISPGAINTPMLKNHLSKEKLKILENSHLLKKIGKPIQIAKTCLFIYENDFFNGNNIVIDGGVTCQLVSE
jgi:NAD(P)-dependent dehydrogenase (short-subunit alcohol dehydrogenase family)